MEQVESYTQRAIELAMLYVPKVFLAIITLIVGWIIINSLIRAFRKTLNKRNFDTSLTPFVATILSVLLKILLVISVASMIGIATTSFIAAIGAIGLAIGLALQGSLANFAGGILILLLKPFKVGDVIEAQGVIASVTEIQIFHTILKSFDNKTIILPNGPLCNDNIINYSTEPTRTVEWIFGIGYDDDIDKAREIIREVVYNDERVLNQETPFINLAELGDSSMNFKVRAQVNSADYWGVFFDKTEAVKKAFDKGGISIPFPQRDLHLFQEK